MHPFFKIVSGVFFSLMFLTSCNSQSVTEKQIDQKFIQNHIYRSNLDLSNLTLTHIPDFKKVMTAKMLEDVLYIDLSNNTITKIQKNAFNAFPNLKEINLSYNQITTLENIENLNLLRKIDLHKNNIKNITLKKLPALQILDLSYNQIESSQIAKIIVFNPLTELSLQRNKLTHIKGLSRLKNLKTIKLEFNTIADVSELNALPQLAFVSVAENPLPESVIQKWIKLSQETMEKQVPVTP